MAKFAASVAPLQQMGPMSTVRKTRDSVNGVRDAVRELKAHYPALAPRLARLGELAEKVSVKANQNFFNERLLSELDDASTGLAVAASEAVPRLFAQLQGLPMHPTDLSAYADALGSISQGRPFEVDRSSGVVRVIERPAASGTSPEANLALATTFQSVYGR